MSYHFPNERRRIERRVAPAAAYTGPERRVVERRQTEVKLVRKPQPMHRGVLWASVAMVLIVADTACLDGAYRHMLVDWVLGRLVSIREWSAHVWDWGH
ncbi:MAG: hypothetical protein PGN08_10285 [Sphingomonas taxi]